MNVSLTPQLEELVKRKVESGLYGSASEVMREALRLLDEHDRLRQMRVEEAVLIPVGRPTVVFSGEDPASRHQFQLEVTAVPQH